MLAVHTRGEARPPSSTANEELLLLKAKSDQLVGQLVLTRGWSPVIRLWSAGRKRKRNRRTALSLCPVSLLEQKLLGFSQTHTDYMNQRETAEVGAVDKHRRFL